METAPLWSITVHFQAQQSTGTGYIPSHKFKANFLDYYQDYVLKNKRPGNRHMEGSYRHLKTFLKCD
jgi:hypothetical protein